MVKQREAGFGVILGKIAVDLKDVVRVVLNQTFNAALKPAILRVFQLAALGLRQTFKLTGKDWSGNLENRGFMDDGGQPDQEMRVSSKWDVRYPTISSLWKRHWERVIPFFAYPAEIRRIVYTTNAVESLNMSLRKIIKTRGSFPSEEAALKLLFLALRNVVDRWEIVQHWKAALSRFTILWEDRILAAQQR